MAASPNSDPGSLSDIQWRFMHHPPQTPARIEEHEHVRELFRELALTMGETLPPGREKSLVLTSLEEGMFWANAAIARQR